MNGLRRFACNGGWRRGTRSSASAIALGPAWSVTKSTTAYHAAIDLRSGPWARRFSSVAYLVRRGLEIRPQRIPMNISVKAPAVPRYKHAPLFPLGKDRTPYRKLSAAGVRVKKVMGATMLMVERQALQALAESAFTDINHLLRPGHLKQLRSILDDKEASSNDKFVAYDFLKNANIAAGGVLPMCQDTGTAIIMGKKGRLVFTDGDDEAALAQGARDAYLKRNLRYSQLAPLSMFEEKNTSSNMPAQVEIYAENEHEDEYKFLFMAKGGGSANKSFLYQATPSILTHDRMLAFLKEKI